MTTITSEMVRCRRCGGAGRIDGYRHVAGGVCFECDGTGFVEAHEAVARQSKMDAQTDKMSRALAAFVRTVDIDNARVSQESWMNLRLEVKGDRAAYGAAARELTCRLKEAGFGGRISTSGEVIVEVWPA